HHHSGSRTVTGYAPASRPLGVSVRVIAGGGYGPERGDDFPSIHTPRRSRLRVDLGVQAVPGRRAAVDHGDRQAAGRPSRTAWPAGPAAGELAPAQDGPLTVADPA